MECEGRILATPGLWRATHYRCSTQLRASATIAQYVESVDDMLATTAKHLDRPYHPLWLRKWFPEKYDHGKITGKFLILKPEPRFDRDNIVDDKIFHRTKSVDHVRSRQN